MYKCVLWKKRKFATGTFLGKLKKKKYSLNL